MSEAGKLSSRPTWASVVGAFATLYGVATLVLFVIPIRLIQVSAADQTCHAAPSAANLLLSVGWVGWWLMLGSAIIVTAAGAGARTEPTWWLFLWFAMAVTFAVGLFAAKEVYNVPNSWCSD